MPRDVGSVLLRMWYLVSLFGTPTLGGGGWGSLPWVVHWIVQVGYWEYFSLCWWWRIRVRGYDPMRWRFVPFGIC